MSRLSKGHPPEQSVTTLAAVPPVHANQCEAAILNSAPEHRVIRVHSAKDCAVTIRTFYFPFWIARDSSGRRLAVEPSPNHLIVVTAPAGSDTIDLRFEVPLSTVRAAGIAISGMTALILLTMSIGLPLRHYFRMQTAQAGDMTNRGADPALSPAQAIVHDAAVRRSLETPPAGVKHP